MKGPAGAHTYAYDAAGNLTSATSAAGTFSYDYGTPGKIIETYPDGTKVTYAVDDAQNLMSVSSGTPGTNGYVAASYTRNAKRLTIFRFVIQVTITIDLCITGTAFQCAGAVVGVAVGAAFTIACTGVSDGTLAAVCYLAGGLISAALQYAITNYGAVAVAWLTNVAFPVVAPVLAPVAEAVAGALQSVYNKGAREAGTILKNIGYDASQVAGALQSVYNKAAAAVTSILKEVGYSASDIASALQNVFDESISAVANLLSDAGFTDQEISAIGGAFASFGQAVKSCFTSLFSHC